MEKAEKFEKRIIELEYRLRLVERFLDLSGPLIHKDDPSTMNSIRMEVLQGMKKDGFEVKKFEKIWGTKFYRKE